MTNKSKPIYHRFDLPDNITLHGDLAIDTETKGLNLTRDRLCCVQLADENGAIHLVHFPEPLYRAPNLIKLLLDHSRQKIFHYARFDLAVLRRDLGVFMQPVFCTKIASRLVRTYTQHHGLSHLCKELLQVSLDKAQQCTDWGQDTLSSNQIEYAANDVRYLHKLRDVLQSLLEHENRHAIANACFSFLPVRAEMDILGWHDIDIFAHSS